MSTPRPPRVRIEHLSAEALAALAAGDLDGADAMAPVSLDGAAWLVSTEAIGTWRMRATQVLDTPADLPWVTGLLVDDDTGAVVGKAGFHAAPDADGMVELGYAVDPAWRRRGYARAALDLATARAQVEAGVRVLRLTISPDNEPSLALAADHPFVRNGEQWDDEDGLELIFELDVS